MKKVLLIVLSLIVTVAIHAKTIEMANGFDWQNYTQPAKAGFCMGFFIANYDVLVLFYETNQKSMSKEDSQAMMTQLESRLAYSESVAELIQKIDEYYAVAAHKDSLLFRVIPFLCGKAWWDLTTDTVEVPSSSNG